ncbi:MAG TPA: DUF4194 domain-containing protein [Hymenobacter sp.]|uniref:DUF4194 domain-containing protein n=1 Tax=Hymenobacter sp. TaxID=1898978 RepID=UPI002D7E46FF|nr:DUF4194 domain-containing protein [Hymenobacter sp.]HET9503040.1 DUF4194 domain-containing protein [Hymenobacter sp.]
MLQPYAWPARQLLLGPIYDDDARLWAALQQQLGALQVHFGGIGLRVEIAPQDGYAFLDDAPTADEEALVTGLPPLLRTHPLSYEATLLAVVLRHWLGEHDQAGQPDGPQLRISLGQLAERVSLLLPPASNQVKLLKSVRKYVQELSDLGFLKLHHDDALDLQNARYEVRRILLARLTPEMLEDFQQELAAQLPPPTQLPLAAPDDDPTT